MSIFNIIILLISISLTNVKTQTESSSEDAIPNLDEQQEDPKNKIENREIQNLNRELIPKELKKPIENSETTKLPMNCIQDYVKYCADKFIGFKFSDGCHECECKINKKDFCPKGSCIYYVSSFEEAADYCPKIEKQNKEKYEIYRKHHQKLENKKQEIGIVKSININKTQSTNKNDNQINDSILKKQIIKMESKKTKPKYSNMDLLNFLNKTTNENSLDKKLEKINTKSPLDIDTLNKSVTNTEINNGNFEERSIEKANNKPLENLNETTNDKEVKLKDEETGKNDELSKFKKVLKPLKSLPENITKILPNDINISNDTKIQNNPVKVSLAKMSTTTIIKAMIYQLASNELTIDRLKKIFKGKLMSKDIRRNVFQKLNNIEKSNSKYKLKILTLVKKEIVNNKNKKSPKKLGKKKIIAFKKILSNLLNLHEALEDMKSEDFKKSKKHYRRKRRRYHKGNGNLKISFTITILSVILVFVLFNL